MVTTDSTPEGDPAPAVPAQRKAPREGARIQRRDTTTAVSVYLTDPDLALLSDIRMRMNAHHPPSKSAVLAQLLRHGQIHVEAPPPPPDAPTAEALRLLIKLSVNLNQIARRLNTQWRSGTPTEQIGMTRGEFTLMDRGLIVLIAYLRGMEPAKVWAGLGLSAWMAKAPATDTDPTAEFDQLPEADAEDAEGAADVQGDEAQGAPAGPTSDEPPRDH